MLHTTPDQKQYLDSMTPLIIGIEQAAAELGYEDIRSKMIYQLLEMLASNGRIERRNIFGDVFCIDIGTGEGEIPVFSGLDCKSLRASEQRLTVERPNILHKDPIETLSSLPDTSIDLITMV